MMAEIRPHGGGSFFITINSTATSAIDDTFTHPNRHTEMVIVQRIPTRDVLFNSVFLTECFPKFLCRHSDYVLPLVFKLIVT